MTTAYIQTLQQVRDASTSALAELLDRALGHASLLLNQQHKHTGDDVKLASARPAVIKHFIKDIERRFDRIIDAATADPTGPGGKRRSPDFNSLSLMDHGVQEAHVGLQGMATHARNSHVNDLLRFTVRLNAQFYRARVDETNNPLDPGNIAESIRRAITPLELCAAALMDVYRQVNKHVFHNLQPVLHAANEVLASSGTRPSLENLGRTRSAVANLRSQPRESVDEHTRAFRNTEEAVVAPQEGQAPGLMGALLGLLRQHDPAGLEAVILDDDGVTDDSRRVIGRKHLARLLASQRCRDGVAPLFGRDNPGADVAGSVIKMLESGATGGQRPLISRPCADVVSVVSLLFDAIGKDNVVPEEPRRLLGETWAPVLQVALANPGFFDNGGHPVRVLLNEFAAAAIGWSVQDRLDDDPVYLKAREAVQELVANHDVNLARLDALAQEVLAYKRQRLRERSGSPRQLLSSSEGQQRLQELRDYAGQKIAERIDGQPVPPLVRELLENHYRDFLVRVLRRDGPGGDSWKPVMDTMDVLLWSVSPGKTPADLERLQRVSERLMTNLANALKIAGLDKAQAEQLLTGLAELQRSNFKSEDADRGEAVAAGNAPAVERAGSLELPRNEPAFERCLEAVKNLNIGAWLEFDVHGHQPIRCTLASRIPSIALLLFVNRQGVKVVEKTEQGLALELYRRSARQIDGGRLMDRAIETVLADLRSIE